MIREGKIRIPFAYAAGPAASRFFAALRDEGRILGSPCVTCGRVLCPARSFCPRCGEQTGPMLAVAPCGTLVSYTERRGGELGNTEGRGCEIFALVLLDGADTAILHRLIGDGAPWTVGARVCCRLRAERLGRISDIEGFERLAEERSGA